MTRGTPKFQFRGVWYPTTLVVKAACDATGTHPVDVEDDEDLTALIDNIVRGNPSKCAKFIVTLNEGIAR